MPGRGRSRTASPATCAPTCASTGARCILNKYAFGGEFPKPDFNFQTQICCSHAKWYQHASKLEQVPHFCIDVSRRRLQGHRREQARLRRQPDARTASSWLEKITGRKCDDELLIEAVKNEMRATSLWAEICAAEQGRAGAARREDDVLALRAGDAARNRSQWCADFYEELLRRGQGPRRPRHRRRAQRALPPDVRHPAALGLPQDLPLPREVRRGLDRLALHLRPGGHLGSQARTAPGGRAPCRGRRASRSTTAPRRCACTADWNLSKPEWQHFYDPAPEDRDDEVRIVKEWERRRRHAAPEPRLRGPVAGHHGEPPRPCLLPASR